MPSSKDFFLRFSLDEKLDQFYERIHDVLHEHNPFAQEEPQLPEVVGVEDNSEIVSMEDDVEELLETEEESFEEDESELI